MATSNCLVTNILQNIFLDLSALNKIIHKLITKLFTIVYLEQPIPQLCLPSQFLITFCTWLLINTDASHIYLSLCVIFKCHSSDVSCTSNVICTNFNARRTYWLRLYFYSYVTFIFRHLAFKVLLESIRFPHGASLIRKSIRFSLVIHRQLTPCNSDAELLFLQCIMDRIPESFAFHSDVFH